MTPTSGGLQAEVHLEPEQRRQLLLADARAGLTSRPKAISPVWFYDERGSTLFEEITTLDEYYPTRAERRLLAAHAGDVAELAGADQLVELGSGSSEKTALLLDAMTGVGLSRYRPLDVSEEALVQASARIAEAYAGLEVQPVVGDFGRHLAAAVRGDGRRLVAFLGGTIGNLTPEERTRFLVDLDSELTFADRLLLGVDLVKDPARLVAAYDDARGVTAAFNRNALLVMNRELDGDFDPERFAHVAVWDPERTWMEMRLRALEPHTVRLAALDLTVPFDEGEELRTEISAKFTPEGITAELERSGFVVEQTWQDPEGYLLLLARPYC